MDIKRAATMLVAGAILAGPTVAHAADPAPAPIQGSSVMGDKGRSGPDGWASAPITRDKGAGAPAVGAGAATPTPNTIPDPTAGRTLPPGQDPATPGTPASAGPGTLNTSAGDRRP